LLQRGMTPREASRLLRVSPARIRAWIASGELPAIDTSAVRCGRPRYIILPDRLAQLLRARQASLPPAPPRRKRQPAQVDCYPATSLVGADALMAQTTKLTSVSKARPCEVCGGNHKCSRGEDGLILCGRTTGEIPGFVFMKKCPKDEQFSLYRREG